MSTFYHTPIVYGGRADDDIFNAPFSEIDAELVSLNSDLGTLGSLTTTVKTNLVGAINELDALIGAAASASGSIATSIDTDGTLKAGAVDVGAVLADGVVTGPKLNSDAMTQPNIVFDPINRLATPGTSWGGRTRWNGYAASATLESPGTANPWNGVNIKLVFSTAGAFYGKYLYFDELGVAEGDELNFSIIAASASGSYNLKIVFTNSDGFMAGTTVNGTFLTGDGTMQLSYIASAVVPAGATGLFMYATRETGTADIDIAAMWGGKGGFVASTPSVDVDVDILTQEIQAARGSMASLDARLDVALNENGTLKLTTGFDGNLDFYGRFYLRDWQAQIAKINQSLALAQGVVLCLGDSWTNNLYVPLAAWLVAEYGDGGAGFAHAAEIATVGPMPTGVTRNVAGTWTYTDESSARGVSLGQATSTDISTPASVAWTANAHAFVIHYIKIPTGGSFRYRVDSGSWTTVDTSNSTELFATVSIAGLDGNSHVLTIEVTVAGTAGVNLCGVDCQKTGNVVRVHNCANNGSQTSDWTAADATIWQAGLAALAPNLVTLMLGVNDRNQGAVPATYRANLETIIGRIRAAMPLADILLLAPGDIDGTHAYTAQDYVNEARDVAVDQSCACLDFYLNLGSYASCNTRGLYSDTVHPNAYGNQIMANLLAEKMLRVK